MKPPHARKSYARTLFAVWVVMTIAACNINVKKGEDGQDKKVDIETPVGGIHVDTNAEARDTGLPVYPGARIKDKNENGDEKSAKVNISSGLFGVKVVAVQYFSDDPPAKLISYYRDQLKKYGNILECHTSQVGGDVNVHRRGGPSNELKCDGDDDGQAIELKVGTQQNQHIVSIKPADNGKSSEFALVFVQTRGGKDTI